MRRRRQGRRLWLRRRTGVARAFGRRLQDLLCRNARRSARRRARRCPHGRDLRARRLLPEHRRCLRRDQLQARHRRSQRARRMGRVLPPLGLDRRRRHPHRHRHEPARADHCGSAGHHSAHQCRRSRHHAGDEPPRLAPSYSTTRSTPGSSPPSARSRASFPAFRRRCRTHPGSFSARSSSSTWCGRALRSTASTRRRRPTIRCSRWSS